MKDRKELKNRNQSKVLIVVYYWFLSRSFNFPPPNLPDLSPTCPTSLRPVRPISDLSDLSPTSFFCVCSLSFSCLVLSCPTTPDLSDPFFARVLFRSRVLSCLVLLVSYPVSSFLVASCLTMFCHVLTCIPLFVFAGSLLSYLPIFVVVG
jgi:hypothetical protein